MYRLRNSALRPALPVLLPALILAAGCAAAPRPVAEHPADPLERLRAGNERFLAGTPAARNPDSAQWAAMAKGQQPFTAVLACADSRVPVERLFDAGFGEIFTGRVAGNTAGPESSAGLEYAVEHLKAGLILVMGHEKCGAVGAAVAPPESLAHEPEGVKRLAAGIREGLKLDPGAAPEAVLHSAVEQNVRRQMKTLRENSPSISKAVEEGKLRIAGAVYDIGSGKVRFLD